MAKQRRSLGGNVLRLVFGAAGLFLLLYPAISVWRLTGEVLDLVPADIGESSTDDRHRLALLDTGDFILAERTFTGVTALEVRAELQAAGFQGGTIGGLGVLSLECCGSYDGVIVDLTDLESGETLARISAADSDIALTWPIVAVPGIVLLVLVWMSLQIPNAAPGADRDRARELVDS